MKCVNLSLSCARGKCDCEESRFNIISTMEDLVKRSRAYRAGLRSELWFDGERHVEHDIEPERIIDEDECKRIEQWITFELDPMKLELEYEIKKELEQKKRYNMKKKLLKGNDIYRVGWATISCSKDNDPPTMTKKVKRLMKSKQFVDSMGVLEFTGAEGQYHPHFHLLFSEKQLKNKNLRDIGRIFNVNHKNPHFVDYKTLTAKDAIDEKVKYIQGDKQELKMSQIEGDKVVRAENGIPDFFSQGNIYDA